MRYTPNFNFILPEYNDVVDVENINDNFTAVDTELIALRSTDIYTSLLASGWVDGVQTISVEGITPSSHIEVGLSDAVSDDEYETAIAALIRPTGCGEGTVSFRAINDTPTIDLPILIRVVK